MVSVLSDVLCHVKLGVGHVPDILEGVLGVDVPELDVLLSVFDGELEEGDVSAELGDDLLSGEGHRVDLHDFVGPFLKKR